MPPIDSLPGEIVLPKRDDIRDQYLRDVRIRVPGAKTIEGTKEFADASAFADQAVGIYFDAKTIGDFVADVNKSGPALDTVLQRAGISRLPAAGGSGFVQIKGSVGGGIIFAGDEIKDSRTSFRFQCTATALYTDGSFVPITGVDVGPLTNLSAGTVLQWTSPRPGIGANATIIQQADGTGLSGGRNQETDAEAQQRLIARRQKPPASGNSAEYEEAATVTPAQIVQRAFAWPCIKGSGSIGISITLRPGTPGANRIPNPTQLGLVQDWLIGQFPAADSILMISLLAVPVDLYFNVLWNQSAVGWADPSPWPSYIPGDTVKVDGAVAPTTTTFRLTTGTSTQTPKAGQSLAFYDQLQGVFRRKRILSVSVVSAGLSWDIIVDTTNNSSDITYTPLVGQSVGPWSDSLAGLVPPIATFFDSVGPGEMIDPLPDPGLRKRRDPPSPATYAHTITNRLIAPLFDVSTIGDIELLSPTVPFETPVGSPGISANLLTLGSIVVYAE